MASWYYKKQKTHQQEAKVPLSATQNHNKHTNSRLKLTSCYVLHTLRLQQAGRTSVSPIFIVKGFPREGSSKEGRLKMTWVIAHTVEIALQWMEWLGLALGLV